jgi:hypothetical protein
VTITADPRAVQAREFLEYRKSRTLAELPQSVLVREAAELRRLVGHLLDLIDEVGWRFQR